MPTPSFVLKSVTARAFRSVVEEQTLQLPTTGMHLILGPSGAGKSTLAEIIAFGLGFGTISATALQSWDWLTKDSLLDIVEVETPKGALRVRRGKQASILMPGEEKARTSAKAVSEGVVQALGLKPEFLAALTYRAQKTPGQFLSMRDGEKKSFLTALLGLERFEQVIATSVTSCTALGNTVNDLKVRLDTMTSMVPGATVQPQPPVLDALRTAVREAEEKHAELEKTLAEMKAIDVAMTTRQARAVEEVKRSWSSKRTAANQAVSQVPSSDTRGHEARLRELTALQAEHVKQHRAEVSALQKELEAQRQLWSGLKAVADKKAEGESHLMHLGADRDQITADVCPTCVRSWPEDPTKKSVLERMDADIAKWTKVVADAEKAAAQLPMMEQTGKDLKGKLNDLQARDPVPMSLIQEERDLRAAIAEAKSIREAKVSELRAAASAIEVEYQKALSAAQQMTPEEEQVRRSLSDLQNAVHAASNKVTAARYQLTKEQSLYDQATKAYEREQERRQAALAALDQAQGEVAAAQAALDREKDFLGMVRGFLSYIFDETLARIADRTNARLALIPNVSGITLRFASERETNDGKLRQEITAVCEKNGHTIPLRDGISGGMFTAVELAVDLSVADVIAERTGVYPGWLFLDECFEGLDGPCRTACFDMLKELSKERAIFVVDHANEMKELFDSRISMEFDGERSRFAVLQ